MSLVLVGFSFLGMEIWVCDLREGFKFCSCGFGRRMNAYVQIVGKYGAGGGACTCDGDMVLPVRFAGKCILLTRNEL